VTGSTNLRASGHAIHVDGSGETPKRTQEEEKRKNPRRTTTGGENRKKKKSPAPTCGEEKHPLRKEVRRWELKRRSRAKKEGESLTSSGLPPKVPTPPIATPQYKGLGEKRTGKVRRKNGKERNQNAQMGAWPSS